MNADNTNRETGITLADGGVRSPYQAPQLAAFGKLVTLTQTGTMPSMEDLATGGLLCVIFVNMTGNMC